MDALYLIETLVISTWSVWSNEKIIFEWLSQDTFKKPQLVCKNRRAARSELTVKERLIHKI